MELYRRTQQLPAATRLYACMKTHGPRPSFSTYTSLVQLLVREGQVQDALAMKKEMEAAGMALGWRGYAALLASTREVTAFIPLLDDAFSPRTTLTGLTMAVGLRLR